MMCFAAFANCCKHRCTWIWIVLASARKFFLILVLDYHAQEFDIASYYLLK